MPVGLFHRMLPIASVFDEVRREQEERRYH
jgi:hypothetical protein